MKRIGTGVAVVLVGLGLVGSLTACGSDTASYKTITCSQWLKKANASDALSNGSLDIATEYLTSAKIDPKGANDIADFGDTISGVCGPTRLGATKIIDLKAQIVDVFLSVHPGDAP